jgi:hypothetical protein
MRQARGHLIDVTRFLSIWSYVSSPAPNYPASGWRLRRCLASQKELAESLAASVWTKIAAQAADVMAERFRYLRLPPGENECWSICTAIEAARPGAPSVHLFSYAHNIITLEKCSTRDPYWYSCSKYWNGMKSSICWGNGILENTRQYGVAMTLRAIHEDLTQSAYNRAHGSNNATEQVEVRRPITNSSCRGLCNMPIKGVRYDCCDVGEISRLSLRSRRILTEY